MAQERASEPRDGSVMDPASGVVRGVIGGICVWCLLVLACQLARCAS